MYKLLKKLGIISVALILVAIFIYIYLEKDNSLYGFFHKDQVFAIIKSEELGFPVIQDNGNLSIYSFSKKKLIPTNIKIANIGFLSGAGSSAPISSPDFRFSVFIDAEKRDLWVLSNETLEKNQVTKNGEIADYIAGWSPDSKKIIYVTGYNEVAKLGGGDGEKIVKSKPILSSSGKYYLFDLTTGTSELLPIKLMQLQGFLDNNRILIRNIDRLGETGKQILALNMNTLKTDSSVMPGIYGPEISQFDIGDGLKKWTFTLENHFTVQGESSIVVADFPKTEGGLVIDSGKWADLQCPKLSPDSTKVAYIKYGIMVYDLVNHINQRYTEGRVIRWFDNKNLIIYSTEDKKLYLLNTEDNSRSPLN